MAQRDVVEINVDIGEDFSAQLYWVDDLDNALPIVAPCRMDVKDSEGTLVLQFATDNDPETESTITLGAQGYMQLTSPKAVTATLTQGAYAADLFATITGTGVFPTQQVKVFSGYVIAYPRTTVMEA